MNNCIVITENGSKFFCVLSADIIKDLRKNYHVTIKII